MSIESNYQTTKTISDIKFRIPKAPVIRPKAHPHDDLPFLELPPLAQQYCDDPVVSKTDATRKLMALNEKLQRQ